MNYEKDGEWTVFKALRVLVSSEQEISPTPVLLQRLMPTFLSYLFTKEQFQQN